MAMTGSYGINSKRTWTTTAATGLAATLGTRGSDNKGQWMLVQADGAITQYDCVGIDGLTWKAKSITTNLATGTPDTKYSKVGTIFGFAQVAAADTEYLWVWIGHGGGVGVSIKGRVAASYAAGAKLYTTATGGVLDDAATTAVLGVVGLSTDSGSGSAVELFAAGYIMLAQ